MSQVVKIFSHNDLDGFGAPYLLAQIQQELAQDITYQIETIGAGRIDEVLGRWLGSPESQLVTDVYIMDMTPDHEYTFQQLDQQFANHWLIFDHHDSEAELRAQHAANVINPTTPGNASATSIVWDWVQQEGWGANLTPARHAALAQWVEAIRAYDTWDWQNDADMPASMRQMADELDQLFWFYPLDASAQFVTACLATDWTSYRTQNQLLIETLNQRREQYLKHHLKDVVEFELAGQPWALVYADSYKSDLGHRTLAEHPNVKAVMVAGPTSLSLRSNGELDVAEVAETYFGGGGHAEAAGARIDFNLITAGEQALVSHLQEQVAAHQAGAATADDDDDFDSPFAALAQLMQDK